MRASEAAILMGISAQHCRVLIRTGKIKARKVSKAHELVEWDVTAATVRKFLEIPAPKVGRKRGYNPKN